MKFRFLLWMIARMLSKASKVNPQLQQQLADKELSFSLQTMDGKVARSFHVQNERISSHSGTTASPIFVMSFRDAGFGYSVMTAKNKQLAFMQGIQNKDIKITGDTAKVLWFQGLFKYVMPKKSKDSTKNK